VFIITYLVQFCLNLVYYLPNCSYSILLILLFRASVTIFWSFQLNWLGLFNQSVVFNSCKTAHKVKIQEQQRVVVVDPETRISVLFARCPTQPRYGVDQGRREFLLGNSRESATSKIPGGNSRELLSSRRGFLGVYKISNFSYFLLWIMKLADMKTYFPPF